MKKPSRLFDPTAQLGVGQIDVVGDPGIVGTVDGHGFHGRDHARSVEITPATPVCEPPESTARTSSDRWVPSGGDVGPCPECAAAHRAAPSWRRVWSARSARSWRCSSPSRCTATPDSRVTTGWFFATSATTAARVLVDGARALVQFGNVETLLVVAVVVGLLLRWRGLRPILCAAPLGSLLVAGAFVQVMKSSIARAAPYEQLAFRRCGPRARSRRVTRPTRCRWASGSRSCSSRCSYGGRRSGSPCSGSRSASRSPWA